MENILKDISKYAILLKEADFSENEKLAQWLGTMPANERAIKITEARLKCKLPKDYIEFLKISNGFPQTIDSINSSLLSLEKVDLFYHLDKETVEIWCEGNSKLGEILKRSILIGGFHEEQQVLLIPPKKANSNWACWKFAYWIPGERRFRNFTNYLKSELDFLKSQTKVFRKQ